MKSYLRLGFSLAIIVCAFSSCKKAETFTPEEIAAVAALTPTKDPVQEEIYAFRVAVRQNYNHRRFANLEERAAALRRARSLFGTAHGNLLSFAKPLPAGGTSQKICGSCTIGFIANGSPPFLNPSRLGWRMRIFHGVRMARARVGLRQ